jgi:hypothetical protein
VIAHQARALVQHNALDVTIHHADVCALEPVEPVDLIVSDFLGCFLVDDRMMPAIAAGARWLKPGGRICPSEVRLMLAPIADYTLPLIDPWDEPFYGVDLSPLASEALRECVRANLPPASLLCGPQRYHTHVTPIADTFDRTLTFSFTRAGRVRALAGWFEAQLTPDIVLTTAPGHETHWMQHLFPLPSRDVAEGDTLEVRLWLDGPSWHWAGTLAGRPFDITEAV